MIFEFNGKEYCAVAFILILGKQDVPEGEHDEYDYYDPKKLFVELCQYCSPMKVEYLWYNTW